MKLKKTKITISKVKSFEKSNLPKIQSILNEIKCWYGEKVGDIDFLTQIINDEYKPFYLAKINKRIAGIIILKINEKTIRIEYLSVDRKFRNIGVGRRLLEFVKKYCVDNQYEKIYVQTRHLARCRRFYRKVGFALIRCDNKEGYSEYTWKS